MTTETPAVEAFGLRFERPAPSVPDDSETRTELAHALKGLPHRWALIGRQNAPGSARQAAYSIRRGLPGWAMFGPGFEAESRTIFGEHRVYARYTGAAL